MLFYKLQTSFLPWAEYWYNTSFYSATNTTPFWGYLWQGVPTPHLRDSKCPSQFWSGSITTRLRLHTNCPPWTSSVCPVENEVLCIPTSSECHISDWWFSLFKIVSLLSVLAGSMRSWPLSFMATSPVIQRNGQVAYKLQLPPPPPFIQFPCLPTSTCCRTFPPNSGF